MVKELRLHLLELLSNVGVTVVEGNRVIEVRPQGAHKGQVLARVLAAQRTAVTVLACGDDRTDEDMFLASPTDALTIHVGSGASAARFQVPDPTTLRLLLRTLLLRPQGRPSAATDPQSGGGGSIESAATAPS